MQHEIKAAGMVYYKNAIENTEEVISSIEYMQNQLEKGVSFHSCHGMSGMGLIQK
jgi:hypothetical protein